MKHIRIVIQSIIIAAGIGTALVPLPASFVERFYSNGLYPFIAAALAPLIDLIPFTLGDLLLIVLVLGLLAWWVAHLVRAGRSHIGPTLAWLGLDTLTLVALVYLLFLGLWGLNYQRQPLTSRLDYDSKRVTRQAERQLMLLTIQELNADVGPVHSMGAPTNAQIRAWLTPSFLSTLRDLSNPIGLGPALPKTSLVNPYFEATSVIGFTDPFTHEVTLTASLLPIEKPFVLAHESSHVAGYASESEANFIALLTCIRSDQPFVRYSGWLALYMYLPRSTRDVPPLAPQVKEDLNAITQRVLTHENKQVSETERKAYDNFLKANRVEAGIGNYNLFVRLVLGTNFAGNWTPIPRILIPVAQQQSLDQSAALPPEKAQSAWPSS